MARVATICSEPGCWQAQPCAKHRRRPFARAYAHAGGSTWQATRARIFRRDGGRCKLRIVCSGAKAEVVDHRIGRAAGGGDDDANLQAACRLCNEAKRRLEARAGRLTAKQNAPMGSKPLATNFFVRTHLAGDRESVMKS